MKNSKFLKIDLNDISKSLVVAFLMTFLSSVTMSLNAGTMPTMTELKTAALMGLGTAVSYLIKNWLTNSDGAIVTPESKKPE